MHGQPDPRFDRPRLDPGARPLLCRGRLWTDAVHEVMDSSSSFGKPPAVVLREANRDDAVSIAELISQLGYATRPEEMRERLSAIDADGSYHTIVALLESVVVGVVGIGISHFYERNGLYGR